MGSAREFTGLDHPTQKHLILAPILNAKRRLSGSLTFAVVDPDQSILAIFRQAHPQQCRKQMDSQGDEDFSYGDMEVTTQSDYDKEQAIPLPQLGAPALPTHDSDEPERITEAGWQTSLSYFERGSVMVSSSSPRSVNTLKDEFDERKQRFRDLLAKDNTKFNLIVAAQNGRVLPDPLKTALKKVTTREGESDFQIISLIRLLFLGDESVAEIATAKRQSVSALDTFPFWPTGSKNQANMDKLVFWSENHLIMTLGSCYLFRQYKLNPELNVAPETKKIILQQLDKTLETKLLKIYLRAHCLDIFNGVYEVNSSVYLPYTLSGLLNLYDFALDTEVKELAHKIIDRVVHHVMLCTTSNGTSNLVAGGRTFIRTRLRTHGHNINQLTNLITGLSPDPWNATAITDYILTTSWIPNFAQVKEALEFEGTHPVLALSHPTAVTRDIYTRLADAEGVNHRELVPLYWSAGLVTHPDYVQDTREYMQDKNMVKNENLSALAYFSPGYLARTMAHYSTISAGQVYTGISLNVYKKPKQNLALTSFAGFNPHVAAFQQQPWIANVSGMGVWSQAGSGSEGIMKFGMTNTHNPAITQKGSVLIASYCT